MKGQALAGLTTRCTMHLGSRLPLRNVEPGASSILLFSYTHGTWQCMQQSVVAVTL